jgi:adenosylcobinamide kinase/adenosylcobinamide-phosphate guanylyltransferase
MGKRMKRSKFILVTGGAKSGKSKFAEDLAGESGKKIIYLATATVGDEEMAHRVERHRIRRPPDWETVEEPLDVAGVINRYDSGDNLILVDCLALHLTNLLLKNGGWEGDKFIFSPGDEEQVLSAIKNLGEVINKSNCNVIMVTNEVGLGLVPAYPLGRIYRDLLGAANQSLARYADHVFLVVCGLAMEIKSLNQKAVKFFY